MLAFDRGGVVTVVTRLPLGLEAKGGWGDTTISLPEGRWRNVLTDGGFEKLNRRSVLQSPTAAGRSACRVAGEGGLMRGRFDVWAPLPQRVRLEVGDEVVEMTRGADDWWIAGGPGARTARSTTAT